MEVTSGSESIPALMGLIGGVVAISALLSGLLERHGLSLVIIFLVLGFAVGPYGLGLAEFGFDSPLLQVAATISLTMVLFSDAVSVQPSVIRKHAGLVALILGPGTLAAAAGIAFAAWWLLEVSPAGAAMLGAALASTDPVLLRAVLRDPKVPERTRQALRFESGLNDAVLLPIVLIALAIAGGASAGTKALAMSLFTMLIIGPAAGFLIGLVLVVLLEQVRKRVGMRRDYESLYALGVALTAFAAAEAMHASGYLAAFTAGVAVALQDVELCDCFHDYGEATAEMALLITFLALGGFLIWTGFEFVDPRTIAFVAIALALRPLILLLALPRRVISGRDRMLLAWFGPRGLSSLLLILLPVFAGVPGAEYLFALCSLVVLVSIVLHGASPALMNYRAAQESEVDAVRITIPQLQEKFAAQQPVHMLDVRSQKTYDSSREIVAGAVRVRSDQVVAEVARLGLPRDAWIALYCTCNAEQTSGTAARALRAAGWERAFALVGGWDAWVKAGMPVTPKPAPGAGGMPQQYTLTAVRQKGGT